MKQWLKRHWNDQKPTQIYFTLAAICAVYASLVLGNMTRWSIWFDEAFSAYLMRFDFADITHFTALDVHPPFYYWVLKVWTNVFGVNELALRSISLVFGVVALIGLFVLIRRLFSSPRLALFATAVVALSPIFVRFGHEARMYTMVLAIAMWASLVLLRAMQKNASRWWWAGYGALLVIGMLTHYYIALAWVAHWVWRYSEKRAGKVKVFFSPEWIWVHVAAVGLFAWWLPTVISQFKSVQAGFWIPKLGAYTPVDYVSNMLLYRQYGEVVGWWAVVFFAVVIAVVLVLWRSRAALMRQSSSGMRLLISMAAVPPLILAIVSLPPLTPTFMDRYILYAQVSLLVIIAIAIALLYDVRRTKRFATIAGVVLVSCLLLGIGNVYHYGNYNKNSNTSIRVREVMQQIDATSGVGVQPVIAASPWIYYEAVFYQTDDNPVYFMDSTADGYAIGSLAMLRDREDGKIRDIHEFAHQHRYVWFIDNYSAGEVVPPVEAWQRIISVDAYDSIDGNVKYRASLFDTQPSVE